MGQYGSKFGAFGSREQDAGGRISCPVLEGGHGQYHPCTRATFTCGEMPTWSGLRSAIRAIHDGQFFHQKERGTLGLSTAILIPSAPMGWWDLVRILDYVSFSVQECEDTVGTSRHVLYFEHISILARSLLQDNRPPREEE